MTRTDGGLLLDARYHHGRLESFPPYVGGDDDEIEEWQAGCNCGYRGSKTPHVTRAHMELIDHLNGALHDYRTQHAKVWEAVSTGNGMRSPLGGEGWRDSEYREWERWIGPMVECPECAFMFGADHFDDTPEGGYSCPNCATDDEFLGMVEELLAHGVMCVEQGQGGVWFSARGEIGTKPLTASQIALLHARLKSGHTLKTHYAEPQA